MRDKPMVLGRLPSECQAISKDAPLRLQIHPQQQVLEARVVAEGIKLMGRHQAFEIFKPVENDVDLGYPLCPDHQKPLSVGGNVVVLQTGDELAGQIRSCKQDAWSTCSKWGFRLDRYCHHLVSDLIKELLSIVTCPHVSQQLGHANPQITFKIYAHWIPIKSQRKAVNRLPSLRTSAAKVAVN
jgi:hypothetical protein